MNIYKITDAEPVDFAAGELKKYLRMMMPEGGDIRISRTPRPPTASGWESSATSAWTRRRRRTSAWTTCSTSRPVPRAASSPGATPGASSWPSTNSWRKTAGRWLFPGIDGGGHPHQALDQVSYHQMGRHAVSGSVQRRRRGPDQHDGDHRFRAEDRAEHLHDRVRRAHVLL